MIDLIIISQLLEPLPKELVLALGIALGVFGKRVAMSQLARNLVTKTGGKARNVAGKVRRN